MFVLIHFQGKVAQQCHSMITSRATHICKLKIEKRSVCAFVKFWQGKIIKATHLTFELAVVWYYFLSLQNTYCVCDSKDPPSPLQGDSLILHTKLEKSCFSEKKFNRLKRIYSRKHSSRWEGDEKGPDHPFSSLCVFTWNSLPTQLHYTINIF